MLRLHCLLLSLSLLGVGADDVWLSTLPFAHTLTPTPHARSVAAVYLADTRSVTPLVLDYRTSNATVYNASLLGLVRGRPLHVMRLPGPRSATAPRLSLSLDLGNPLWLRWRCATIPFACSTRLLSFIGVLLTFPPVATRASATRACG